MTAPATPPAAEVCTIVQVSPTHLTTYTLPKDLYDVVLSALEIWPLVYGRPKPTMERILDWVERNGYAHIRRHVTVERKAAEPGIRGLRADVLIHDTLP